MEKINKVIGFVMRFTVTANVDILGSVLSMPLASHSVFSDSGPTLRQDEFQDKTDDLDVLARRRELRKVKVYSAIRMLKWPRLFLQNDLFWPKQSACRQVTFKRSERNGI